MSQLSMLDRLRAFFRGDREPPARHSPPPGQEPPLSPEPTAEEIVEVEQATHHEDTITDPATRRKADGT